MNSEYYAFFGLEPRLALDEQELQARFYKLSREWHPDRFSTKSAAEQQRALDATAVLNDGYRTLKDPLRRAKYVLKQHGFDIGEQRSKDVPPELLEEVFELNMALEELRSGDASVRPQLEAARGHFLALRGETDTQLAALFSRYDAGRDRATLGEIRGVLNRRRYIENLVREVDKTLEAA